MEESNGPLVTPEKKGLGSRKMGKHSAGTPDSLDSGRVTRRSSTGSYDNGDNARGYSSEKRDSANIGQRGIPHYLRASTGSCHDICKYGRRHAFEEKATKHLSNRTTKPSLNEQKKEKVVKLELSANTQKHSHLVQPSPDVKSFLPKAKVSLDPKTRSRRLNPSYGGKTRFPNSPTKNSSSPVPSEIIKRETVVPENVEVPVKEDDSIDNKVSRTDKKTFDQSMKHSSSVRFPVKVKSSPASDSSEGIRGKGGRDSDVQTGRKVRASMASANKASPVAAPLFRKCSLSKTASNEAKKPGRVKLLSPRKDQNWTDGVETETSDSNGQVSEKTLHVIKTGTSNNPSECIPENHDITALASPSSPVSLSRENSSPMFHENDVEEIKYRGNDTDEFVADNTLRMETEDNVIESTPDGHVIPIPLSPSSSKLLSHSDSPSSSSNEEDDEEIKHTGNEADKFVSGNTVTVETNKAKPLKRNNSKNVRKNRVVISVDKYCRPLKLKFRSGKVVDLRQDNNVPRRLRFRSTRVGCHNGKRADDSASDNRKSVEIGDRILRKSRVVVSKDKSQPSVRLFGIDKLVGFQSDNNIPWRLRFRRAQIPGVEDGKGDVKRINTGGEDAGAGADLSSRKANLKHHNLQRKKNVQYLFNNVIEETASKLVETRQSKVKALVGAFETVISLQVRKPSLPTAS